MLIATGIQFDIQQAILGLGPGAIYALLGLGLVMIYRGSGVLNFAHGAMAAVGALQYIELREKHHWSYIPAVLAAVLLAAVIGAAFHWLIMRRLAAASAMARTVATLGLFLALVGGGLLRWTALDYSNVMQPLPHTFRRWGEYGLGEDRMWLLAFTVLVTVGLWAAAKYTTFGLVTTAAAENQLAAETLGWSADLVAAVNWAAGSAMAALAGVLFAPLTGIQIGVTSTLVIPAMAVALVGGFRSFPLTLLGGVVLGSATEVARIRITMTGVATSLPFLVIVVLLVVRGRPLPVRDHVFDRLPELGTGRVSVRTVAALSAVMVAMSFWVFDNTWYQAIAVSFGAAIVMLSIVVVTGFAGQVSLAQYTFAGFGALVCARLVHDRGWPLPLALALGTLACIPVGALFGLPALRTRGVTLAVVTLGLGLAAYDIVFSSTRFAGGTGGLQLPHASFFGIDIDPILQPRNYALFTLACFVACALFVANLRRSRVGRRLIAVRANERAAAALGVNVVAAKLYAFALSAAIAGFGGILLAFRNSVVVFTAFDAFSSITYVANAVVGGVGFVIGPLFGQALMANSTGVVIGDWFRDHRWVPTVLFGIAMVMGIRKVIRAALALRRSGKTVRWFSVAASIALRVGALAFVVWVFADTQKRLLLAGGVATLAMLTNDPHGLASGNVHMAHLVGDWLRRRVGRAPHASGVAASLVGSGELTRVEPGSLELRDVTVRFGGVVALDNVSFDVAPGEVVGLIGPNGAGKTTLIDAVTGFNMPTGSIALNGKPLIGVPAYKRARLGLSRSFQALELFDDLSVADNLRAASDDRDSLAYLTSLIHSPVEPLKPVAASAVDHFDLAGVLDARVDSLPYGRRRLAAVARAVASAPSVLLLDEPAAGLGGVESSELASLVRELADRASIAVLLVEHDMDFVMSICDRIVVLDFGRKIAEGTPDEIRANPAVIAAYLGVAPDTDSHATANVGASA